MSIARKVGISMGTVFSETLTKLRREAGFRTPYRFYQDSGGAPALKISYGKYLALEQGITLPLFKRLIRLIYCLRLIERSPAANELVTAWLRTLAGEEDYGNLLEPIISPRKGPVSLSPMHKAMRRSLAGRKHYLSIAQYDAIVENRDNYLCYLALVNDEGKWSPAELSKFLKLTPGAAVKALEALARVKILKKDSAGRYKCPLCGKMIEYPHYIILGPAKFGKLLEYFKELSAGGKLEWERFGAFRADAETLRDFLQIMQLNVSTAQSYAVTGKTAKSALFAIKGTVVRLRDF